MRVAPVLPTFACMFRRTPKSSPVVESSSTADVRHEADLRVGHLDDWRDAAKREGRAYVAWCAAGRGDRHHLYAAFLDALRREEVAARQVEDDASALGAAHPLSLDVPGG